MRNGKTNSRLFSFLTFLLLSVGTAHAKPRKPQQPAPVVTTPAPTPSPSPTLVTTDPPSSPVAGNDKFPTMPDDKLTPGALCVTPTEYRYSEKIPYCARNVDPSDKAAIIRQYDQSFGYAIEEMNRADFKIDHLIPLCVGGANERTNLWPQHKSVYTRTDRIEEGLCKLMAAGKLQQSKAVEVVLDVKHHLEKAEQVLSWIQGQL